MRVRSSANLLLLILCGTVELVLVNCSGLFISTSLLLQILARHCEQNLGSQLKLDQEMREGKDPCARKHVS